MDRSLIGIVGLGLVGQSLGERVRSAGWPTLGFDLRAAALDAVRKAGGIAAASVREVGQQCECVLLAVFDTHGVIATVESPDGLLAPGHRVRTVIDCSTGSPELLAPLSQRLKPLGVDFIEAPLSGSSRQIAAGEATLLLGGDGEAIARCDELLDAIATRRIHAGSAGMGSKAKLATNLVLGLNRAALAEGMVFAQALGIEPERFLDMVLATPARSDAAQIKGSMMVGGDFTPQSRIRQHLKDVDLMLQSAHAAGLPLPLSEAHAQLMRDAIAAGDGDLDNAAIIRQLRRAGGMSQ